jgi:hypothetical protein
MKVAIRLKREETNRLKKELLRTGACPIIQDPENKELLMHLGSFTLDTDIIDNYSGKHDINASYYYFVRFLLSGTRSSLTTQFTDTL